MSRNGIKQLSFAMDTGCVFFEVETEFLFGQASQSVGAGVAQAV
jgi:hypothetical protein